jgi:hypothetical protein
MNEVKGAANEYRRDQWLCAQCLWWNLTLRNLCRNCKEPRHGNE